MGSHRYRSLFLFLKNFSYIPNWDIFLGYICYNLIVPIWDIDSDCRHTKFITQRQKGIMNPHMGLLYPFAADQFRKKRYKK